MGKEKYLRQVMELFRKSQVVTFSSIERIVRYEKKKSQYAKQLTRNLLKQGRILQLTKGAYTLHNEISLIVYGFQPAYFGLQDALSFHNLWEQETIPVVITTRKVRQGIRKVLGANVLIRRIQKNYFFGFEYHRTGSVYVPYSDIEKTFIDMVYFREHIDAELLKILIKNVHKKKLAHYLQLYPQKIKDKVLNYV